MTAGELQAQVLPDAHMRRPLRAWLDRLVGDVPARELAIVAGIAALGFAIRLVFVLAFRNHTLFGDEIEYNVEGRFIAHGHWLWSTTPFGFAHPTIWKAPGYPAFVGVVYSLFGSSATHAIVVQTLFGPVTIVLTWLLARRLFTPRIAVVAAAIVAVYPFAWEFETRLAAESIVTPFTLLILLLFLERRVTPGRAAAVGALVGLMLLIRPSAIYLVPAFLIAWVVASGWRRGVLLTVVSVVCMCLVVLPWTIRNHHVTGSFVPISSQDQAPYGVFNNDAARDQKLPWAWRYRTTREAKLFAALSTPRHPSEVELRRILRNRAIDYVKAHPSSLVKAFYWNGITRLWDVRRPGHVLDEATATGRSRAVTGIGLAMYWVMLPLALAGLWLFRGRRGLVLPLIAMAATASVVFTTDAVTRYRAPFEPVIVILAVAAASQLATRWSRGRARPSRPRAARAA
ncbi:MAG: glycosyltransferase family 39 protein [Thermoleophilaceae bacterium]